MRKYIVNNKEVEYLHIEETHDGTTIVTFEEKFNLINAHMGVIMERLRDNNLSCHHVFKDFKHGIIVIYLKNINDLNGVLHALCVPHGCYEVDFETRFVTIDIPVMERMLKIENHVEDEQVCVMKN